ncbi:MAG TPA: ABC transporter permease subunit [Opitutaceae bacterium]|nr:ABC transporter permease subunit [Opitutaceae bacterium]
MTAAKVPEERRPALWMDAVVLLGVAAIVLGVAQVASEWRHPLHATAAIDLSISALPKYALFSFARGWIAYFLSLLFTIVVASWAYYDPAARRYVLPSLDILQSIPVLGFLPGITLALIALFPRTNTGLELVCILAIFVGQVWNMVFSYYDSLRGTPADIRMLGQLYNFNWWNRLWRLELPFGAQGLVYNSMMSMAGGWFFLSICENPPPINGQALRVPGLGSYMAEAIARGNVRAQLCGVVAMGAVIVVVDRLIWAPLVVWSRKFKMDDFGGNRAAKSAFQLWLARSRAYQALGRGMSALGGRLLPAPEPPSAATSLIAPDAAPLPPSRRSRVVYGAVLAVLAALVAWGGYRLLLLLLQLRAGDWLEIARDTGLTFLRVSAAVAIGTLWTVPLGVSIGLNPKLAARLQPFIQFVASFPAPMIYPWLVALVFLVHGTLQWGAVLLLLFGAQWYILFNVAGAAAAIPNDMVSCADLLRLRGWERWQKFLLPAILPGLVTGWITAAGGAWNATIVSEAVQVGGKTLFATGLGAYITRATGDNHFPQLAAAVIVMAVVVVGINRTVWKRLQAIANDRCRFIA